MKFAKLIFCVFLFDRIYSVSNLLSSDGFSRFLNLKMGLLSQFLNPKPNFFGKTVEKQTYLSEYDFIIVGSGPAGCVLANRLSENPYWNILLIEAGNVENAVVQIPVFAAYTQLTDYSWNYVTVPQENGCLGLVNQSCAFPLGKAAGGSSILYYMIYNRGNRRDYDRWAANGNYGWSWNDVLPYFKKSEHATMEDLQNSPNHGKNGPANIEYNRHRTLLAQNFIEANKLLGLRQVDYNSGDQIGVSFLQSNNLRGQRQTSFRAFIEPILDRPNLHIMVKTRATKVLIDPETKSAYGVQYVRNKKIYTVKAKKEVILSAGCFNSPQLLMLSGIGPREELNRIGVPLLKDLPVGKQLFEHVAIMGITFLVNTTQISPHVGRDLNIREFSNWLNGNGKFVLAGGVEALAFLKTKEGRGPEVPDVELLFIPGSLHSDEGSGVRKALRMPDETYNKVYKPLETRKEDSFMIMPMQFHPKSVGYVKLKDKNPFHWPILNPRFFSDPEDVETMLDGIKYIMKLVQTPPFQRIGARLHDIPIPGCSHIHFASDDYWRCYIKHICLTLSHQAATNKMGPATDPETVVSPELKVHGINNLRVVDISILPEPPTTHTHAVSMMIGEKGADMIKNQWK